QPADRGKAAVSPDAWYSARPGCFQYLPPPLSLDTGNSQDPAETRRQAQETLAEIFKAAKAGRAFTSKRVHRLVESGLDHVLYNPSTALALAKTRGEDNYTFSHSVAVAALSTVLALNLGYDRQQIKEIALAALLHDVGKAVVPNSILDKTDPLTDEEWLRIKE